MTTYPRNFNKFSKPGTWQLDETGDDTMFVMFTCPICKHMGSLSDHEIADDGTVTPSVDCPTEGCLFHENIQLEDWPRA